MKVWKVQAKDSEAGPGGVRPLRLNETPGRSRPTPAASNSKSPEFVALRAARQHFFLWVSRPAVRDDDTRPASARQTPSANSRSSMVKSVFAQSEQPKTGSGVVIAGYLKIIKDQQLLNALRGGSALSSSADPGEVRQVISIREMEC